MTASHAARAPIDAGAASGCIGVFDSGVGGLSVLRALHLRLPAAALVYAGDVAHAPYGERPAAQVLERCERLVEHLVGQGARMIVVACNTATVLAIDQLRERWPQLSFVGVEPGVKPAATRSRSGRIAVMVTPATAASARLRRLIEHHADGVHVHVQPCPGLADAIERGALQGPALLEVLQPCCDAIRAANVDTVVLGCTHYPFVADSIRSLLGAEVTLIDTATAIAERVASLWPHAPGAPGAPATVRAISTGATDTMQTLLSQCPDLEATEVTRLSL